MGIQVIVNASSDDVRVSKDDVVIRDDDDTVDDEPRERRPRTRACRGHFEFDIPEGVRVVGWGQFFKS